MRLTNRVFTITPTPIVLRLTNYYYHYSKVLMRFKTAFNCADSICSFIMKNMLAVLLIMLLAFAVNIPLGYLRSRSRRYSVRWYVYVHLSIPIIVLARILSQTEYKYIPLFLLSAAAGQYLGGKMEFKL